jgi:hypothetical protein
MLDDVKITYQHHEKMLTEREALEHLTGASDRSLGIRILVSDGPAEPYRRHFHAWIGATPGKPCSILCSPGPMNAEEAEAVAVLLVTARLMALTADRERAKTETRA